MAEQKITLGEMRASGARGLLVYCVCSHWIALPPPEVDKWSDSVRLSDLERRFKCAACGERRADVRPHFDLPAMGTGARK